MKLLVVSRRYPPDQFSGTETVIAELVRRAREARGELIPGTAHLPNLERPQRVNELLRGFLG